MQIIPAVDLLDGAAVRLLRGDYGAVTGYGRDPAAIARGFASQGAGLVHVVDLEAARGGQRQIDTVESVLDAGVPIQLGGGIRTARDARWAVDAGASRVVVGSALVGPSDGPGADIVEAVGAQAVVAAVDVRDGRALGSGWLDGGSALGSVLDRIVRLGIPRMGCCNIADIMPHRWLVVCSQNNLAITMDCNMTIFGHSGTTCLVHRDA